MTPTAARNGGLVAIVVTLLLVLAGSPADAQVGTPIVVLDRASVAPGEVVRASGVNWPANATITLEVCGNLATGGSIDCDLTATTSIVANNGGFFATNVTVNRPPSPCPCVVKASSLTSSDLATANVVIEGVPMLPEAPVGTVVPIASFLTIDDAKLSGSGPWSSWFGFAPKRTLEFTIHNTGNVAIDPLPIVVTAGHGDNPTGYVPSVDPETLAPGESRTIAVPIEFDAFSFGTLAVRGEMTGLHVPLVFHATAKSYPWGFIALAVVVVQMILLRVRSRVRARIAPASELGEREIPDTPAEVEQGEGARVHA